MKKKFIIGLGLILLSVLYGLQEAGFISGDVLKYFLNYQVILIIIGLFVGIAKKKTSGWIFVGVGAYLYIQDFFERFTRIGIPLALLIIGIGLVVSSIMEKKKIKAEKNIVVDIKTNKKDNEEI